MNEHLNANEIIQAVNKSPQSLAAHRYKHFESCDRCQLEYSNQLAVDEVLKTARPKTAPAFITRKVIDKLSVKKLKEKTDWVFLISIVLLFSIAAWFVFSGKAGSVIKEYTPQVITDNKGTIEPTMIDKIKDGVSTFDFSFNLPDLSFRNMYLAIGILAILFYMVIDRKINRNFKVRKT